MVLGFITSGLLSIVLFGVVGRALESGEWEGFVTMGRGGDSFKPCNSRDIWWLKSKGLSKTIGELKKQYSQVAQRPYEQVYVRLRGAVSKKGQFGPLGSYQRVIYVEEIMLVREKQEADCSQKQII